MPACVDVALVLRDMKSDIQSTVSGLAGFLTYGVHKHAKGWTGSRRATFSHFPAECEQIGEASQQSVEASTLLMRCHISPNVQSLRRTTNAALSSKPRNNNPSNILHLVI